MFYQAELHPDSYGLSRRIVGAAPATRGSPMGDSIALAPNAPVNQKDDKEVKTLRNPEAQITL